MHEDTTVTDDGAAAHTALETETVNEETLPDGVVTVELAGVPVRVLPVEDWTSGAQQDLSSGQFDAWAEDCLYGDDYDIWAEMNNGRGPKLGDVNKFFEAWAEASGQNAGKSRRSIMPSRRTRRR